LYLWIRPDERRGKILKYKMREKAVELLNLQSVSERSHRLSQAKRKKPRSEFFRTGLFFAYFKISSAFIATEKPLPSQGCSPPAYLHTALRRAAP
jgi:hypothetical protein